MRIKPLILGVAAALGLSALVVAQTTPLYNLSGLSTVVVTLESGSSIRIPLNQIRNTMGVSPVGTGTTVNVSPTGTVGYIVSTGAITTLNVTLPNPAYSGQQFILASDGGTITTARVTASSSPQTQTLTTAFASTVNTSPVGWIYYTLPTTPTTGTWFRIQ
jgi:hypothetical protein